jgi:hypothetical protein
MPTNPPAENWESEAKKLLSKICCDGQYVQESINFLRTTIEKTLEEQREKIMSDIEERFGCRGTMNGSLGYQGLVMDITAYQTPEDKQRDEILQIIQNMK